MPYSGNRIYNIDTLLFSQSITSLEIMIRLSVRLRMILKYLWSCLQLSLIHILIFQCFYKPFNTILHYIYLLVSSSLIQFNFHIHCVYFCLYFFRWINKICFEFIKSKLYFFYFLSIFNYLTFHFCKESCCQCFYLCWFFKIWLY